MTGLPDPLTPPDCDLRGFDFMPLDTIRLLDSDLFALSTGDEFKAALALWCKSWAQVPAGSLPDDDRVLAFLSGTGPRWRRMKELALRHWIKCADGRLYHPVVAEKALEAWERRGEWIDKQDGKNERQRRWRERQRELCERLRAIGITPPKGASLETLQRLLETQAVDGAVDVAASTRGAGEMPKTGTGTGTGTGTDKKEEEPPPASHAGKYAFTGETIRLSEIDLARWRKTFHAIVDIEAELTSLDAWFQSVPDKRKNWFHIVSSSLSRKHQAALAAARAESDGGELELPIA